MRRGTTVSCDGRRIVQQGRTMSEQAKSAASFLPSRWSRSLRREQRADVIGYRLWGERDRYGPQLGLSLNSLGHPKLALSSARGRAGGFLDSRPGWWRVTPRPLLIRFGEVRADRGRDRAAIRSTVDADQPDLICLMTSMARF